MTTIAKPVYLYAKAPRYGTEIEYFVSQFKGLDVENFGRVVASTSVDFQVPDSMNLVAMAIEELEAEKAKAADAFRDTMKSINERLAKLQAITNEVQA